MREMLDRRDIALGLYGLGWVALSQGDDATARALYTQSLAILKELDAPWTTALCLERLADVAVAQGHLVWAAQLWGAAEALREANDVPMPPVLHLVYESMVRAARVQLGENAFTLAWTEGRSMTPEHVLAEQEHERVLPPAPKAHRPSFHKLTARQVEVLRLVAKGLTNAQVAERLVISVRTIEGHLNVIYEELQVSCRSAAIRVAREHKLL